MEIPVDMVDDNEIPRESAIKYDAIARIVGSLYLDYHLGVTREQERYSVIIQELQKKLEELEATNTLLKDQLRKINEQKVFGKSDNSGED